MQQTMVKIPREEYAHLVRIRTAFERAARTVAKETGRFIWEDVPVERERLKPAFARSLRRALKQADAGKLKAFDPRKAL